MKNNLSGGRVDDSQISFDEFIMVLREYLEWDGLDAAHQTFKEHVFDPNSELGEDDQLYELNIPMMDKSSEIFRKYGLFGAYQVFWIEWEMRRQGVLIDDTCAIRAIAKEKATYTCNYKKIFIEELADD